MKVMYALSVLSIPILVFTAIVMYRRKQHKIYLIFWTYLIFQFSRVTVQCIAYKASYGIYFYSYWISSACSVVFRLLLLRSIFLTVLEGYSPLNRLRRFGYDAVLFAFWAVTLFLTYGNHHRGAHLFPWVLFDASQAVSLVAVGMFVFVVGSSALLGLRWTTPICGIALGVGLLGITDLAVFAALAHNKLISSTTAGWIETLTFDCAAGIFAFTFVPKRQEIRMPTGIKLEWVQWLHDIRGAVFEKEGPNLLG